MVITNTYEQDLFLGLQAAIPRDGDDPAVFPEVGIDPKRYRGASPLGDPELGDRLTVHAISAETLTFMAIRRDPRTNGKEVAALVMRQWGGGYGGLNVAGTSIRWREDEFGRRICLQSKPALDVYVSGVLEALADVVQVVPRQRAASVDS